MMKSVSAVAGLVLGGLLLSSGAQAANLLINGSFDDTTNFTDNTGHDTDQLAAGSTAMNGWTVGATHAMSWVGPTNNFGLTGNGTDYFLDMTDFQNSAPFGSVQQTFATVAGGVYSLSFDLGSDPVYGLPSGILVTAGSLVTSVTSTNVNTPNFWETELLSFTATGSSTVLTFTGNQGQAYIGLDNVSVTFTGVTQTPIPASLLMFGTAMLGLGFAGYRRNKKDGSANLTAA